MRKSVHQYIANFSRRDAVGENAIALQALLMRMGFESHIFCHESSPEASKFSIDYLYYYRFSSANSILLIHYGMKLQYLNKLLDLPDKKFIIYHNVTPAKYFTAFSNYFAGVCDESRKELRGIRNHIDGAIGCSQYNVSELNSMGYSNTECIPLLLDFKRYEYCADKFTTKHLSKLDFVNWLFVGRIAPNKKQDDLIRIFYFYQRFINPNSRLILVGHSKGMESYKNYLERLVSNLNLNNVEFTGTVSQNVLSGYFKSANLFISMSEHEGFCVPLLEAFYYGVPVIAFDSSAIGETLGDAGILIKEKNYEQISELANYVIKSRTFRETLIIKQKKRLNDFSQKTIEKKWKNFVENYLG